MARQRWRWDKGRKELVEIVASDDAPPPRVWCIRDIEPYQSPVTGEVIGGRRQRRDDLKRHECIDARDAPTREEGAKIREERLEEGYRADERYLRELVADR